jgi:hypothetical protein
LVLAALVGGLVDGELVIGIRIAWRRLPERVAVAFMPPMMAEALRTAG